MTAARSIASPHATTDSQAIPAPAWEIKRPLMSVWSAALLLNCGEHAIENHVADGKLAWAFDIGYSHSPAKGCVRIFTRCVLDFCDGVKNDFTESFVLNSIFPEARERFTPSAVAFAWHCGEQNVDRLIKRGVLKQVPHPNPTRARWRCVSRDSLIKFLRSRRRL
jgi:hypothetical protein